jgi:hypothetical protein
VIWQFYLAAAIASAAGLLLGWWLPHRREPRLGGWRESEVRNMFSAAGYTGTASGWTDYEGDGRWTISSYSPSPAEREDPSYAVRSQGIHRLMAEVSTGIRPFYWTTRRVRLAILVCGICTIGLSLAGALG